MMIYLKSMYGCFPNKSMKYGKNLMSTHVKLFLTKNLKLGSLSNYKEFTKKLVIILIVVETKVNLKCVQCGMIGE